LCIVPLIKIPFFFLFFDFIWISLLQYINSFLVIYFYREIMNYEFTIS
jgi:hypothetical protein